MKAYTTVGVFLGALGLACCGTEQQSAVIASGGGSSNSTLADAKKDFLGLQGIRLHFAKVLPVSSGDDRFPRLCPRNEDCFYSISAFFDGRLVLDDSNGRVESVVDDDDLIKLREIIGTDTFVGLVSKSLDCPSPPAGADIKVGLSTRWVGDIEQFYSPAGTCVVGEIVGVKDHPLTRLRTLLNDEFRNKYVECPSPDRLLCKGVEFFHLDEPSR